MGNQVIEMLKGKDPAQSFDLKSYWAENVQPNLDNLSALFACMVYNDDLTFKWSYSVGEAAMRGFSRTIEEAVFSMARLKEIIIDGKYPEEENEEPTPPPVETTDEERMESFKFGIKNLFSELDPEHKAALLDELSNEEELSE